MKASELLDNLYFWYLNKIVADFKSNHVDVVEVQTIMPSGVTLDEHVSQWNDFARCHSILEEKIVVTDDLTVRQAREAKPVMELPTRDMSWLDFAVLSLRGQIEPATSAFPVELQDIAALVQEALDVAQSGIRLTWSGSRVEARDNEGLRVSLTGWLQSVGIWTNKGTPTLHLLNNPRHKQALRDYIDTRTEDV